MRKRTVPREVVNVIPAGQVTLMALQLDEEMPIEVREKRDGTWSIFYPEEGFIPYPPGVQHGYTESYYKPTDREDAIAYAEDLSFERDVKVIPFKGNRS